jgi:hypothetical protein
MKRKKVNANEYFRHRITIDKLIESIESNRNKFYKKLNVREVDFFEMILRVTGALMDKQLYVQLPKTEQMSKEEIALLIGELVADAPELKNVPTEDVINMFLDVSHRYGATFNPTGPLFSDTFFEMIDKKFATEN